MKELLYGAAYYDEYMPYERLAKDVSMMQKAGINTVRIAESTWSTCEPQEGVFDFSHVIRVSKLYFMRSLPQAAQVKYGRFLFVQWK